MQYPKFEELLGKTLTAIDVAHDREAITFRTSGGDVYRLYHSQDCCECVRVEEIHGEMADLIGTPLLQAEEVSNADGPTPQYAESFTWTFYKLATIKGSVTLRWLGESNGYYSESVSFDRAA
jgi:hypothetical protein